MYFKKKKYYKRKKFTLIELIIVIVVIGILSGMALPKFLGISKDVNVAALQRDLDVLEKAMEIYKITNLDSDYPLESEQYFKNNSIPKTLSDSLLLIGDYGSDIRKIDMDKLSPYLDRLKYSDTEYLYSLTTNTVIDPIGMIDSKDNSYHLLSGGIVNIDKPISELPENPEEEEREYRFIYENYYYIISNTSVYALNDSEGTARKIAIGDNEKIKAFDVTHSCLVVLTTKNNIYRMDLYEGNKLEKLDFPKSKTYEKVSSRGGVFAVTSEGEVYGQGDNQDLAVSPNSSDDYIETAVKLNFPEKIKDVICSDGMHIAISETNKPYIWGTESNLFGEEYVNEFWETKAPVGLLKDIDMEISNVYVSYYEGLVVSTPNKEYYYYGKGKNIPIIVENRDSYSYEDTHLVELDKLRGLEIDTIGGSAGNSIASTEPYFYAYEGNNFLFNLYFGDSSIERIELPYKFSDFDFFIFYPWHSRLTVKDGSRIELDLQNLDYYISPNNFQETISYFDLIND